MATGRKRMPDWIGMVDGNRRQGSRGGLKPKVTPAPEHLTEQAKATWEHWEPVLREMGLFLPQYTVALEEACELKAEILELRQEIATNGRYYTTTNKAGDVMRRPHPAQGQLADAQRRLATYLAEFGLTPAGRVKLLGMKTAPRAPGKQPNAGEKAEEFFG